MEEIVEIFSEHFATVGSKLAEKITVPKTPPLPSQHLCSSIFLSSTNKNEVIEIIETLKQITWLDIIRTELKKNVNKEITLPIAYIIKLLKRAYD